MFIVWFRYGNFDYRPGDLFEPNDCLAMKHAVLSTVRQPGGKYRLLEDPLLPESRKRKLRDELVPSGSSYLHQIP